MSEKTYVINVKTKLGTIFTVRADTAEELDANITSIIANDIAGSVSALEELIAGVKPAVVDPISVVTETLGATVISETPTTFAPVPPPQTSSPTVGSRTCTHGTMIARKGSGAKGEWKGLFCPTPKGTADQCQPVWLTRKDVEWNSI